MEENHRTRHLVMGKESFTGPGPVSRCTVLGCVAGEMAHAEWIGMESMFTVNELR